MTGQNTSPEIQDAVPAGMSGTMPTESVDPALADLDKLSALEIVREMNDRDRGVAEAVARVLPAIARAVEMIVEAMGNGGRLIYIGAGTSGRLGIIDAAECPPTFGVSPEWVQGIIAGGKSAVFRAREGCEDRADMGARDLARRDLATRDVVCGLTTSGRTPYVLGGLRYARRVGARTIAVFCNPEGPVAEFADVAIVPVTGSEILAGSTRLKAGTAEKMVINMLSTASMIKLGRVSGNQMTHMHISCEKLRYRALQMIMGRLGVDEARARTLLAEAGDDLRQVPGLMA